LNVIKNYLSFESGPELAIDTKFDLV